MGRLLLLMGDSVGDEKDMYFIREKRRTPFHSRDDMKTKKKMLGV